MPSYGGQKHETRLPAGRSEYRNPKQIQNPKRQIPNAAARFERGSAFLLFFFAGQKKAKRHSPLDCPADVPWLCLFEI